MQDSWIEETLAVFASLAACVRESLQLRLLLLMLLPLLPSSLPLPVQVYDISSGQTLLDPPISGCTGELVWWGNSSDVLVYITQVSSAHAHICSLWTVYAVHCIMWPTGLQQYVGVVGQQQ